MDFFDGKKGTVKEIENAWGEIEHDRASLVVDGTRLPYCFLTSWLTKVEYVMKVGDTVLITKPTMDDFRWLSTLNEYNGKTGKVSLAHDCSCHLSVDGKTLPFFFYPQWLTKVEEATMKVGDTVLITKPKEETVHWKSYMDAYDGKVAVVCGDIKVRDGENTVQLHGSTLYFLTSWLTKVETPAYPDTINVGDTVLITSPKEPHRLWTKWMQKYNGLCRQVESVTTDSCRLNYSEGFCFLKAWLTKIPATKPLVAAKEEALMKVGDTVLVTKPKLAGFFNGIRWKEEMDKYDGLVGQLSVANNNICFFIKGTDNSAFHKSWLTKWKLPRQRQYLWESQVAIQHQLKKNFALVIQLFSRVREQITGLKR